MSFMSRIPFHPAAAPAAASAGSAGAPADAPRVPEGLTRRLAIAFCSAVAIGAAFVQAVTDGARFSVLRSDQMRLQAETPAATVEAFRMLAGAMACARAAGIEDAEAAKRRPLFGLSQISVDHWRDGCGGAMLVVPLFSLAPEQRPAASGLAAEFGALGASLRHEDADAAARHFHERALRDGIGYRLVAHLARAD